MFLIPCIIIIVVAPVLSDGTTEATSISLSWTSAGSVVDSYEVMWQRDTSGGCPDEDEDSISLTDGSTSYDIMGLEEDSSYSITVTASNAAGSSATSNTVTAVTGEAGKQLLVGIHNEVVMCNEVSREFLITVYNYIYTSSSICCSHICASIKCLILQHICSMGCSRLYPT